MYVDLSYQSTLDLQFSLVILYPLMFGVGGHMSKDFPPPQNHKLIPKVLLKKSCGELFL